MSSATEEILLESVRSAVMVGKALCWFCSRSNNLEERSLALEGGGCGPQIAGSLLDYLETQKYQRKGAYVWLEMIRGGFLEEEVRC